MAEDLTRGDRSEPIVQVARQQRKEIIPTKLTAESSVNDIQLFSTNLIHQQEKIYDELTKEQNYYRWIEQKMKILEQARVDELGKLDEMKVQFGELERATRELVEHTRNEEKQVRENQLGLMQEQMQQNLQRIEMQKNQALSQIQEEKVALIQIDSIINKNVA